MKKRLHFAALTLSALCAVFAQDAAAHTGFGMAVDRQGRAIFLDSVRSKVWRIEPDGRLTTLATEKHADNLAQDSDGNLYVQHANQTLWKIASDGSVTQVRMPANAAAAGQVGSLDELLAMDRDGNFYVRSGNEFYGRSPQILKITPRGETLLLAGSSPGHADGRGDEARFSHVRSAAWGPDGALYVADGMTVRRVTLDGQVTTLAGAFRADAQDAPTALENGPWLKTENPVGFNRLLGIAVDAYGNVFVVDSDNFRVCRIAPGGQVTTIHEIRLPWKPTGVAVSGDIVYVMDRMFIPLPVGTQGWFDTHRVRRIAPDGSVVTVATVGGGGGYIVAALLAGLVVGTWRLRARRKEQVRTAKDALPSGQSVR